MESLETAQVVEDGLDGCAHRRAGKRSVLFVGAEDLEALGVELGAVKENFTVRANRVIRGLVAHLVGKDLECPSGVRDPHALGLAAVESN